MTPTIIDRPSPNHSPRAHNMRVDTIIIHHTATEANDRGGLVAIHTLCDPRKDDPSKRVSAHYLIGVNGHILRLVPEDRTAWHAGVSCMPWEKQKPGASVNGRSIGIEVVNPGDGKTPFTEAQYAALCWLVPDIVRRQGWTGARLRTQDVLVVLPRFVDHPEGPVGVVLGHRDVAPGRKTDPADNFDWSRVRKALEEMG